MYSPPWGSSSAIRSGSSSATRSDSSWETAGRASQHVKASEMSLHQALAATCKACKEIVLTSVGFFVGDSVGFFVGDSVGFFVGDCRKGIAARQGVRDEPPSSIRSNVQGMQRDCTHLRGVLRRRFGRVLRRRLGHSSWETAGRASCTRSALQEGHQHVKASEMSLHQAFAATCKACKEIVLTSVGFFVGDSVGFFVGDSVGFFVGDCRKGIAARQGVRDEPPSSIRSNVQGMQRDCTHLRGVLRRRFGRVLRRRLGRILRGRLQEGHRSTSRRQR